jgi:hypothetical protein
MTMASLDNVAFQTQPGLTNNGKGVTLSGVPRNQTGQGNRIKLRERLPAAQVMVAYLFIGEPEEIADYGIIQVTLLRTKQAEEAWHQARTILAPHVIGGLSELVEFCEPGTMPEVRMRKPPMRVQRGWRNQGDGDLYQ